MNNIDEYIACWLREYALKAKKDGFVVGVSGGVDSAVTSTLCAMTNLTTFCLMMPIHQAHDQVLRAHSHVKWLTEHYPNVKYHSIPLTTPYTELNWVLPPDITPLAEANTKSRLRMVTLYAYATTYNLLVAGTGNKVEDFGCGFFTKGGDGGVDLSPIGNLTKTEVWDLAKKLGINEEIINATPTDGLWSDNRSDEDQMGASYPELEKAMAWLEQFIEVDQYSVMTDVNNGTYTELNEREKEVLNIYWGFHTRNRHKMLMPPICPKYEA